MRFLGSKGSREEYANYSWLFLHCQAPCGGSPVLPWARFCTPRPPLIATTSLHATLAGCLHVLALPSIRPHRQSTRCPLVPRCAQRLGTLEREWGSAIGVRRYLSPRRSSSQMAAEAA